jgi:D-alanyl-D-alanine carboxypeptidase/D-alanyl-D-alanine-endopeptidase (penicillin-binding protein 4)
MPGMKIRFYYVLTFFSVVIFSSCSVQKQISRSAQVLIQDPLLAQAHTGISIFEPATGKYWYNYQADKLFVPASNTKIPTCYAAMKYLGDSLLAIEYAENDTAIFLFPTGDPTFLHPGFKNQPLFNFLKNARKKLFITDGNWKDTPMGSGWPWDDYNDDYAVERNGLPVYGNLIKWIQTQTLEKPDGVNEQYVPSVFSEPEVSWEVNFDTESKDSAFFVKRKRDENSYTIYQGKEKYIEQQVPFVTAGIRTAISLLKDTIGKEITITNRPALTKPSHRIYSQPVDSFLTPMMHHSDNFFAEQAVLMVSNKLLGVMNDQQIMDTLLKTDFKDLPQRPHWVDGSGLSHYDLFSPMDFIFILNKMNHEFGLKRVESIFPTGGTGTLKNFYRQDSGYLFAKTGTLSGVVTLSGYLHTSKNKLLLFSVLVNNREAGGADIRRVVERFLQGIRKKY